MGITKRSQKRQFAQEKEMAEYAYTKDVEMWNMANQYNSPTAQMDRLKAANLNPNLVYGNGSVVGNTSTQTPKYQKPNVPNYVSGATQLMQSIPNILNIIGQFQDVRIKKEETRSKAIENQYLAKMLNLKADNLDTSLRRKFVEVGGQTNDDGTYTRNKNGFLQYKSGDTPFSLKYQSSIHSQMLDNAMKELEYKFYNSLGTGSKASQFIMQMLLGAGNIATRK